MDLEISKSPYQQGNWILKNVQPITIIFGKNGSGKSVMLRNLLQKNIALFHYVPPERVGEIEHDARYGTQQQVAETRAQQSRRNISGDYRKYVLSRISTLLNRRGNIRKTSVPDMLTPIEDRINEIFIDFTFKITNENPPFLLQRKNKKVNNNEEMSSGEAQIITLSLDLLTMCSIWKLEDIKGTLLIDEPDAHIHPDLQQKFAKFLVELTEEFHCSIILATHSTSMLSALGQYGSEKTGVVYIENKNELYVKKFSESMKLLATCLGGHVLMGSLFGWPLILVEGEDDYKIWIEFSRKSKNKFSIISCNGSEIKTYQENLEMIFESMLTKSNDLSGFALVDHDKSKFISSKQNHIKFIQLACHESENLYFSDENLNSMKTSWENVKTIINQSDEFIGLRPKIETLDRKTMDWKGYIEKISEKIETEGYSWQRRLGKTLGNLIHPTGQLEDFLGKEVVETLWSKPN